MQCARIASISTGTNFNKCIVRSSTFPKWWDKLWWKGVGLFEPQIASLSIESGKSPTVKNYWQVLLVMATLKLSAFTVLFLLHLWAFLSKGLTAQFTKPGDFICSTGIVPVETGNGSAVDLINFLSNLPQRSLSIRSLYWQGFLFPIKLTTAFPLHKEFVLTGFISYQTYHSVPSPSGVCTDGVYSLVSNLPPGGESLNYIPTMPIFLPLQ